MFESFWKQSELVEKLKESDELQKDFIRIAVHELKNPIQPIVTLSHVLRSKFTDKEDLEALNIISRNANKLVQLSNDVLDVTRIETKTLELHKEYFDIVETMKTFIDEYNQQLLNKNIKLTLRSFEFDRYFLNGYDSEEGIAKIRRGNELRDLLRHKVYADKDRILQVMYNLLNNAVKFTNQGEIAVYIFKESHNNTSIIHVSDSGIGIDNQIIDKLFSKFVTKSERGTGLGLFICKNLIEAHGGRIWAKNNINQTGATFSFTLPFSPSDLLMS
jgi:signal transduction histidine kinase